MNNKTTSILRIAQNNPDGFTVELDTLKKVTNGISVAYAETQNCFGVEGLQKVIQHAEIHDRIVGGWFNDEDGRFYFDSVKIFTDRDEAIEFGRRNKQIAIFDIGNIELIKL